MARTKGSKDKKPRKKRSTIKAVAINFNGDSMSYSYKKTTIRG